MAKEENTNGIKEPEISKNQMVFKILKLLFFSLIRLRFYVPGIPEIKINELHELIESNHAPLLLDCRDEIEFYAREGTIKKYGHIPNSKLIPAMQFPANMKHLSSFKDEAIVIICQGGGMSLVIAEIMLKAGFTDVKSLRGGTSKWSKKGYPMTTSESLDDTIYFIETAKILDLTKREETTYTGEIHLTLDARNWSCPKPVLTSKKKLNTLNVGQVLEIFTTDPGSLRDIPAWANVTGQEILLIDDSKSEEFRFLVKRLK
jgi:TusA-related sulfurtransferase/rhodanese-related sulfurtransferase